MFLSKRPSGKYHLFYKNSKGVWKSISTKTSNKVKANKFMEDFIKSPNPDKNDSVEIIRLNRFCDSFEKYSETVHSKNHTDKIKTTFKFIKTFLGDIPLTTITLRNLEEFKTMRLQSASTRTVRRDLANLSSAFSWGISQGYLKENIVKNVKHPKLNEKLPLFFTTDEFNSLLKVIESEDLRDLIEFAVNTALRQTEIITLEWNQVYFESRQVTLDNRNNLTKSGKVRSVPLNSMAIEILSKRLQTSNGNQIVFTYMDKPIKQHFISHKFKKFVKKAPINQGLNFHSLRHTAASWMVQRGASIYNVQKILGHSDLRVTSIYSHLRSYDLQNSVNLLDQEMKE